MCSPWDLRVLEAVPRVRVGAAMLLPFTHWALVKGYLKYFLKAIGAIERG